MSKTRTELTSQIITENVLSLSVIQTQIESNFKTIVEALKLYDGDISILLKSQNATEKEIKQMNSKMEESDKRTTDMEKEIQKLKNILMESQKNDKQKSQRSEGDARKEKELRDKLLNFEKKQDSFEESQKKLLEDINKLKNQLSKINHKIDENKSKQPTNDKRDGSGIQNQIKKLMKESQKHTQLIHDLEKKINEKKDQKSIQKNGNDQSNNNFQQWVNDEYQPTKKDIYEKLKNLQSNLNETKKNLEEEKRIRSKLGDQVWKISDVIYQQQRQKLNDDFNADLLKKIQGDLESLRKKFHQVNINSDKSLNSTMLNKNTNETFHESPTKGQPSTADDKSFRKQVFQKLNDQKQFLLKTYKKIQHSQNDNEKNKLTKLEEDVLKLDYLLGEKADLNSVKKLLGYLENKIIYIYNVIIGNNNEEDACIARRNWVCLSCEKKLDKYQGKIGNHIATGQLKAKGLDQQMIGGGMSLKGSKSKVDLPKVFRKKQ